jgi:hypothetical protein
MRKKLELPLGHITGAPVPSPPVQKSKPRAHLVDSLHNRVENEFLASTGPGAAEAKLEDKPSLQRGRVAEDGDHPRQEAIAAPHGGASSAPTPLNAPGAQEEVAPAPDLAPDRRPDRRDARAFFKIPARRIVGQGVERNPCAASARAHHREVPQMARLTDRVEVEWLEVIWLVVNVNDAIGCRRLRKRRRGQRRWRKAWKEPLEPAPQQSPMT